MSNMNGIDVSGWQSNDITRQVPADFGFVKATEGLDYVSKSCDPQIQGLIDQGRKFGFYHFISGDDPIQQADYFCKNTEGYFGHGIPVVDWEGAGMRLGGGGARKMLDRILANHGVKPLIYMSLSPAQSSDMSQVAAGDYGLWVAYGGDYDQRHDGYVNVPADSQSGVFPFAIARQYTSQGFLNGQGPLDLNVFYGDGSVWDAYAGGKPSGGGAPQPPKPAAIDEDGIWGGDTTGLAQTVMGTTVDRIVSRQQQVYVSDSTGFDGGWDWSGRTGDIGSALVRAIQLRVGASPDGKMGHETISKMQAHMGTPVDGRFDRGGIGLKTFQSRLNAGTF